MFFVFGWEKTFKPAESLLKTRCHNCNRTTVWRIWHETEWVSLFFVRLVPFSRRFLLVCDDCRDALALDAAAVKGARSRHRLGEGARLALHDEIVARVEDHQLGGLTEGQRQYYRNMRDGRDGGGRDTGGR